jgi:peptidoglycan/LPS O-acetylase OafA/YrhL
MTATVAPARIPELDGLRGLAILLVILCHYVGNSNHLPLGFWRHLALSAFSADWSGVDLFFVLSGFLIGGILLDARNSPQYFRAFYMRRVFRILPIYYLWTLLFAFLVIAALVFFPGRFPVSSADLLQVPLHLLFWQNMHYSLSPFQWIWFGVTWSLAVEEQFYLVAPPLIRFLSLRALIYALACGILLAIAWRQPAIRAFLDAYPSSLVPLCYRWLYGLNPMAGVIDGFRWALTGHGQPPGAQLAASAFAVLVILGGGLLFFQRMEGAIADRV